MERDQDTPMHRARKKHIRTLTIYGRTVLATRVASMARENMLMVVITQAQAPAFAHHRACRFGLSRRVTWQNAEQIFKASR